MRKKGPNSELVNYIWTYLHQGYSLTSIRESLVHQNYSEKDINFAVDFIYANYYYGKNQNDFKQPSPQVTSPERGETTKGVHHGTLWALMVMGVLLIGFSFVFVLGLNSSSSSDIPSSSHEIVLDDGYADYYDNSGSDQDVTDDSSNFDDSRSSDNEVVEKVVIPDRTFNGDVDDPFDSGATYTKRQIELKVDYFSSVNPREAIKFCDAYLRDVETYFCYRDVAVGSGNSAYCDIIDVQKYKDDCYLSSVLENIDYGQACNKIVDDKKKENCFRIVDINEQSANIQNQEIPADNDVNQADDSAAEYYAVVANFY